MTSQLEVYQRGMLALVKNRGFATEDPYLRDLAGSRELAMLREIAIWWRTFQIDVQCRFTSRLLKRLDCFEQSVTNYFDQNATSAFVEELSHGFLMSLRDHPDPLVRSITQFESAFLRVRGGSLERYEVLWDRHPDLAFVALEKAGDLPPAEAGIIYCMTIARDIPRMFSCVRETPA
jgi:hypothetical protein